MLKNALSLFLLALLVLFLFIPSYTKMQDKRLKNLEYDQRIEYLIKKRSELLREKTLLNDDPVYLEKVAREKMGLVKPGEVVVRVMPYNAVVDKK